MQSEMEDFSPGAATWQIRPNYVISLASDVIFETDQIRPNYVI